MSQAWIGILQSFIIYAYGIQWNENLNSVEWTLAKRMKRSRILYYSLWPISPALLAIVLYVFLGELIGHRLYGYMGCKYRFSFSVCLSAYQPAYLPVCRVVKLLTYLSMIKSAKTAFLCGWCWGKYRERRPEEEDDRRWWQQTHCPTRFVELWKKQSTTPETAKYRRKKECMQSPMKEKQLRWR
jgi:hypothetical protein